MPLVLLRRRFLAAAALGLPAALFGGTAAAQSARITFVLVNDIYQMSEQMMPDGKRRGGFARLAAVVKAERAKGGHVIFAHAGDTLSPSLMSGIDRGEHIITLTNLIAPDIFAPGNHEFDFGKATFLRRMARGQVSALCGQSARSGRTAAAQLQGPLDRDRRRRSHRAHRRGVRRLGAGVEPGGPPVPVHGRDHAASRPRRCVARAPISSWR